MMKPRLAIFVAFAMLGCGGCCFHLHWQERHYHEPPAAKSTDDSQREYDDLLKRMEDARDANDHPNGEK